MEYIQNMLDIVSNFDSPWQVIGFVAILAFVFGCLWLLYRFLINIFDKE